jgi:centractin
MASDKADGELFVGDKATDLRGILRLNYPMRHGITSDWGDMTNIWQHTYDKLNAAQEEHPVLLTEPPLNPMANRAKTAEIFFEQFKVPALYMQVQAILSLYASGRTTGVVLDSGDGVTHAVPVFEGFALPHAISRIDVAGRDVTEYLQTLLRKGEAGYNFHTSAEFEVVRRIKEEHCYIAYNVSSTKKDDKKDDTTDPMQFKLPDGQYIELGDTRYLAPECLFNPALLGLEYPGIHTCLVNSITKADLDIRARLYSEVVLSGGTTKLCGFGDRLLYEVRQLIPKNTKVRIYAPQERTVSTWVGGSILASLSTFKQMWVTKEEYRESGANALHRKAL